MIEAGKVNVHAVFLKFASGQLPFLGSMTQRDWYGVLSRMNLIAPFLVGAEERGFRMAALRMHISQSTVSVQVN